MAGTWNLHEALTGHDSRLQFFVVCGSIAGVMGNAGQANYSSANAFLTSFTQYRLRAGLPASVVNLGAVNDIGHLAVQDQKLRDRMFAGHVRLLSEQEVLDAFEIAMLECQPSSKPANESSDEILRVRNDVIMGMRSTKSLADPSVRPLWGRDARFSVYANLRINKQPLSKDLETIEGLQQELAACEKNPDRLKDPAFPKRIVREVIRSIQEYSNFARGQDYAQVAALPIDSLMTVEFRNWSRRYFNLNLPLTAIAKAGTVEGLLNWSSSGCARSISSNENGAVGKREFFAYLFHNGGRTRSDDACWSAHSPLNITVTSLFDLSSSFEAV